MSMWQRHFLESGNTCESLLDALQSTSHEALHTCTKRDEQFRSSEQIDSWKTKQFDNVCYLETTNTHFACVECWFLLLWNLNQIDVIWVHKEMLTRQKVKFLAILQDLLGLGFSKEINVNLMSLVTSSSCFGAKMAPAFPVNFFPFYPSLENKTKSNSMTSNSKCEWNCCK